MLETRLHDLYVDSRRSNATYCRGCQGPCCGGTRFTYLAALKLDKILDAEGVSAPASSGLTRTHRSTILSVPSGFHCPMSPCEHVSVLAPATKPSRAYRPEPPISGEDARIVIEVIPLEITLGDRCTAYEDLATRRGIRAEVPSLGVVPELDFDSGHWNAHWPDAPILWCHDRTHAYRLCQTVS